jgi:hypothetical protein
MIVEGKYPSFIHIIIREKFQCIAAEQDKRFLISRHERICFRSRAGNGQNSNIIKRKLSSIERRKISSLGGKRYARVPFRVLIIELVMSYCKIPQDKVLGSARSCLNTDAKCH